MASGWSCELEEKNKKETKKWYLLSLPIQKQLWQLQEKLHAVREALTELSEPRWQDIAQHLVAVSDERSHFLVNALTWDAFCGLSSFPQLLESRAPVPWAESLFSFLSTAFQRKRDHWRGDSGKFWVLAQIAGQKEFPLPQCQVDKTGKRDFPLYFCTFWNTVSFFRDIVMEIHLSLLQEKENTVKNYFPSMIFFDCLPHSLSYDRLSGPSTHGEVIVTELLDSVLWSQDQNSI